MLLKSGSTKNLRCSRWLYMLLTWLAAWHEVSTAAVCAGGDRTAGSCLPPFRPVATAGGVVSEGWHADMTRRLCCLGAAAAA